MKKNWFYESTFRLYLIWFHKLWENYLLPVTIETKRIYLALRFSLWVNQDLYTIYARLVESTILPSNVKKLVQCNLSASESFCENGTKESWGAFCILKEQGPTSWVGRSLDWLNVSKDFWHFYNFLLSFYKKKLCKCQLVCRSRFRHVTEAAGIQVDSVDIFHIKRSLCKSMKLAIVSVINSEVTKPAFSEPWCRPRAFSVRSLLFIYYFSKNWRLPGGGCPPKWDNGWQGIVENSWRDLWTTPCNKNGLVH